MLIIVDETDDLSVTGSNACIARTGASLIHFLDVMTGNGGLGLHLADNHLSVILAVVIDDPDGHIQSRRHRGTQQAGNGSAQQRTAIISRDYDVKLHISSFRLTHVDLQLINNRHLKRCFAMRAGLDQAKLDSDETIGWGSKRSYPYVG